ncbi:MAG TPA: hypothetical protein VFD58_24470 [Blastocatellia bacterium]|nr:hypothetical protein [Blastocatellia bacterium]
MKNTPRLEKRLRISGSLIIAGLLVELVTLRWSHPTAFLFFLLLGGALMAGGILLYLYSLVSSDRTEADGAGTTD